MEQEKKKSSIGNTLFIVLGLLIAVCLIAVGTGNLPASVKKALGITLTSTDYSAPDYLKDFVAYKEGEDGIVAYFILGDDNGQMTAASGRVQLEIYQTISKYDGGGEYRIKDIEDGVGVSDFHETKIGKGNFEHDALVYSFGRITLNSSEESGVRLKLKLKFTSTDGKVLTGVEDVYF